MTQIQLAERVGITFQQLQKYEKSANRISVSRLLGISEVSPRRERAAVNTSSTTPQSSSVIRVSIVGPP